MNHAIEHPASAPQRLDTAATRAVDDPATHGPLARRIAGHALLLGIAGDTLLRDLPVGAAFPLWIALLVLAAIAAAWSDGRRISREMAAWLAAAVLFSCGLMWRDSSTLHFLDFLATMGALGMAAIASADARSALLAARFRDTVWATASLARTVAAGFVPIALRELFTPERRQRSTSRLAPILRAAIIVALLVVVFGSLLREADPIFASLVRLPELDVALFLSHAAVIGFYAWMVSGWARGALVVDLGRKRAPDTVPFGLGMLDITMTLATLNVLFASFVVAQLGWFFGGESFLRARTGLTASAYARQGFFEMLWVVLLVIPLLVATRAALRPGRDLERRHTALSLPVIALLGAIILSAAMRMRLYVHYYGLTTDRLYPLIFMGWLGVVLAWLSLTVLRGRGRPFIAGVALSGLAVLAALNVAAPDAFVARFNMQRAAHAARDAETVLDLTNLAELSAEAAEIATEATLASPRGAVGTNVRTNYDAQRCDAARTLLDRWGPLSQAAARRHVNGSWRFWSAGQARAVRVVGARSAALRTVTHLACKHR